MQKCTITPENAVLGAKISDVDLKSTLHQKIKESIRASLFEYSVLLFQKQSLTKQQQVHFSQIFGQPVPHPTNTRDQDEEVAEITIISNVVNNGRELGALGNSEVKFHSDLVFLYAPGSVSILQCLETPESGGETYWSSNIAAYDTLSPEMVKRLRGLKVIYKHRNQAYNPDPLSCHPLLCTHPDSRKKFLFVSSSSAQRIQGMGLEESQSLLDSLFVHTTQDKFVWEHKWSKGDIIVWDNRTTLHRRNSLDSNQRRIMYRTQILGPLTI